MTMTHGKKLILISPQKILETIKVRRKRQQNQLQKRELYVYAWQEILDIKHSQIKDCISSSYVSCIIKRTE